YNRCDWLTIEAMDEPYDAASVHAKVGDDGVVHIRTENVTALQLARDIADRVEIDGNELPLANAAGGLLPGVFYSWNADHWELLDYDSSRSFSENSGLHKRHNLQGPIDDAFMEPFVCVLPTGKAWNESHAAWGKQVDSRTICSRVRQVVPWRCSIGHGQRVNRRNDRRQKPRFVR
ncbi:MAG: hypothetical protein NT013_20165, partial [Planctomycetia bacterium]|nr:hypothetical protein [Planctomycetia bacterium]